MDMNLDARIKTLRHCINHRNREYKSKYYSDCIDFIHGLIGEYKPNIAYCVSCILGAHISHDIVKMGDINEDLMIVVKYLIVNKDKIKEQKEKMSQTQAQRPENNQGDIIVFVSFPMVGNPDIYGTLDAIKKVVSDKLSPNLSSNKRLVFKSCFDVDKSLDSYDFNAALVDMIKDADYIALGEGWREKKNCVAEYNMARKTGAKCLEIKITVTEV